ncbi:D-hydantoinase [Aaosphaeria arxii CBS 175.79]|uniref:D-hydantoinase n=1 Tax=Aaosphaeria arxii CBS 175.79 TaxID=1450172 RepID=A0A6A5XQK8_9PLEO|nr:D-hydantoinase [Aaosphaeria arxii CBS 175.79]KAF2015575.1 D-hydantoinase [Aaosphaeria arxii CBS 175.79]
MGAEYDVIIVNGVVVTDTELGEYDVAIKGEKIIKVVPRGQLKDASATRTIDAEGGYVMPGGVDAHVHLQEPPLFGMGSTADTYETGSRSAVCGGTTTMVTFAPQKKSEDTLLDTLKATHEKAKDNCYIDYSFHLLVGNPSERALSEFKTLRDEGISSLKIYMTYEALQLNDSQILDVLLEARRNQITTMVHAENGQVIDWMTAQLEKRKLFAPKYHGTSHPPMAEIEATYRAISLSEFIDSPILIVHVSTPAAAKHIKEAQDRGIPIYAETCPQYLFLTKKDLDQPGFEGAKCVCSPPPRESEADCDVIWDGIANGTFTILSSDHCPFRFDDNVTGKKTCITDEYPQGHFKYIPNGIAGIETRLSLALGADRLDVKKFVEVTSANPAKLYGLWPKKGALIEGESDADINIWYPPGKMQDFALTNDLLHHDVDYTAFEGRTMKQWPRYTLLRGKVVWDKDGKGLLGEKGYGRFVKRGPSMLAGPRYAGEWEIPL